MRTIKLAVLALALASGTAHAAPLKLELRTRFDAALSALTGQPRKYPTGSTVASREFFHFNGGPALKTTKRIYRVGAGGKLALEIVDVRHTNRNNQTTLIDIDDLARNERDVLTLSWDSSSNEKTRFTGTGRDRIPVTTEIRRYRHEGSTEAVSTLDHKTGLRQTTQFHLDGSRTISTSQVTHNAEGLEVEEPLSSAQVR